MTDLRTLRESAGLTQVELAERAGVSRQLVGAVEAGRHLPRVDAALALAATLGVEVESLFASDRVPVDVVSGLTPAEGTPVRFGQVGGQAVTAPVRVGAGGWDVADGVIDHGIVTDFERRVSGFVVAGCEPGLEVIERLLRERGMGAVSAMASSATARSALVAGRVHAAVVHGPELGKSFPGTSIEVDRFRLTTWQVGLAGPSDAKPGWWQEALSGRIPVVQRESGAGVQHTFESAVGGDLPVAGPLAATHLEAAQRAVLSGMPAVTIEPAALAAGAAFHPLEVHHAQLWVAREWIGERAVGEALNVIASQRFQLRLRAVGGYDLTSCGASAA